jgi:hypothetical protein
MSNYLKTNLLHKLANWLLFIPTLLGTQIVFGQDVRFIKGHVAEALTDGNFAPIAFASV